MKAICLATISGLEHPRLDRQLQGGLEGLCLEPKGLGLQGAVDEQRDDAQLALVGGVAPTVARQAKPDDPGGFIDAQRHTRHYRAPTVKRSFPSCAIAVNP